MPELEGKHYPYTAAGIAAWKKAKREAQVAGRKKTRETQVAERKKKRTGQVSAAKARRLNLPSGNY
jgi:hypothetical protein